MANVRKIYRITALLFAVQIALAHAQADNENELAELNEAELICEDQSCRYDLRKLHRLARFGSMDANTLLGVAYVTGDGLKQDIKHGIGRLKIAVRYEHAPAMLVLSDWYASGQYVEQDAELAAKYLDQAVQEGYPTALYRSALSKLQHEDPDQVKRGIEMLEEASDADLMTAMYLLARLKYVGGLVEYDLAGAADLFRRLSISGHEQAPTYLREIIAELESADNEKVAQLLAAEQETNRHEFIARLQDSMDIERIQVYGQRLNIEIESPLTLIAHQLDMSGAYMRGSAVRIRNQGCNEKMGCINITPVSGHRSLNEMVTGRTE